MNRRGAGAAPRLRGPRLTVIVRLFIYAAAAIVFFVLRSGVDSKLFSRPPTATVARDTMLVLSGADVAPLLIDTITRRYNQDYPQMRIDVRPGSTAQALQDLADVRADAAFLARPPSAVEQGLFTRATGDTALWFPVSLGAVLVVASPARGDTVIAFESLRQHARGKAAPGRRLYVPDPNSGLWTTLLLRLGLPDTGIDPPAGTIFLKDEDAVIAAVLADAGSIGVVNSFALRRTLSARGVQALAIRAGPGSAPVAADNVTLSTGDYPLWCYVYVACRARGGLPGSKFVTYLTDTRGQRQIGNTAYLPARLILREIYLNRTPAEP